MGEESKYKGYTPAHNEAHKRYMSGHVEIRARVTQEDRDAIQAHAQAHGESVNGFIKRAIAETMKRDDAASGAPTALPEGNKEAGK